MEKYEVKTVPLTNLIISPVGPITPICDTCCNLNCGHPIEKKDVSIFGKVKRYRVYVRDDTNFRLVLECKGYIRDEENNSK